MLNEEIQYIYIYIHGSYMGITRYNRKTLGLISSSYIKLPCLKSKATRSVKLPLVFDTSTPKNYHRITRISDPFINKKPGVETWVWWFVGVFGLFLRNTLAKFNTSPLKSYQNPIGSRIVFQASIFRGELLNFGGVFQFNVFSSYLCQVERSWLDYWL